MIEILPFLASASGSPTICHTFFFVGILVDQRHRRAELDGVAGQLRHVDHLGARELVLELGDAALVERLRFLGGVIFGVLRQVAVRARLGDLLNDARPFDLLALLQFVLQHGSSRRPSLGSCPSVLDLRTVKNALAGRWFRRRDRELIATHTVWHWAAPHSSDLCWPGRPLSSLVREIGLQRTHLEVSPEIGLDPLRRGDGA